MLRIDIEVSPEPGETSREAAERVLRSVGIPVGGPRRREVHCARCTQPVKHCTCNPNEG